MNKIKIVTDSTTSLSLEECETLGIICLETSYVVDGENFSAFENENESLLEFYSKLDKIKSCSTGCITENTFEECFDKIVTSGYQVFYVGLSASLSSTYSNSELAAENINKKYGKKVVSVVDGRSASYGTLCLIEEALDMIEKNYTLEQIESRIDKLAHNMSVAFICRDLSFLQKSGRIGTIEAGVGKLLHIVPIVYVSETGKLKTGDKCLGTKKAYQTLKNKFSTFIKEKKHTRCTITSCGLDSDVDELKKYIEENTDIKNVETGYIDKTLACCCGPKTMAIFCC